MRTCGTLGTGLSAEGLATKETDNSVFSSVSFMSESQSREPLGHPWWPHGRVWLLFQETWARFLVWEDLTCEIAHAHSSIHLFVHPNDGGLRPRALRVPGTVLNTLPGFVSVKPFLVAQTVKDPSAMQETQV